MREESALEQFDEMEERYENQWSKNGDSTVREIKASKLTRPGLSSRRRHNATSSKIVALLIHELHE